MEPGSAGRNRPATAQPAQIAQPDARTRGTTHLAVVHEQAAAFALDALDPDETAEFERHLVTCPACEDALQPLRFVAATLAFAGDLPAPRPELRVRVLDVGAVVIPLHRLPASRRQPGADSAAIATVPPPRPSVPSSRPGADVPMELLI